MQMCKAGRRRSSGGVLQGEPHTAGCGDVTVIIIVPIDVSSYPASPSQDFVIVSFLLHHKNRVVRNRARLLCSACYEGRHNSAQTIALNSCFGPHVFTKNEKKHGRVLFCNDKNAPAAAKAVASVMAETCRT